MGYCSIDDLRQAIPEADLVRLTDEAGLGVIDVIRAQSAIETAAREIDTYLGNLVRLPIQGAAPAILVRLNAELAIYSLWGRVTTEIPETWREKYRINTRLLEKIQSGELSLGLQPPPDPPEAYQQGVLVDARPTLFGRNVLDRY